MRGLTVRIGNFFISSALIFVMAITGGCSSNDAKIAELEEKVNKMAQEAAEKAQDTAEKAQETIKSAEDDASRLLEENSGLHETLEKINSELQGSYDKISELEKQLTEKDTVIVSQQEDSQRLIDRRDEAGTYYDEEDLLWWLVVKFDEGWIRYINAGDETIFKYIVKDSPIYNMAVNYRSSHNRLKQKMTQIGRRRVVINGDSAKIHVYESLEEIDSSGNLEPKEYYWVYSAVKRDNVWYLTEMIRDN